MNGELTTITILVGILHSGIRLATPYMYAAIGEMFSQRSGVLNLGVDGIITDYPDRLVDLVNRHQ